MNIFQKEMQELIEAGQKSIQCISKDSDFVAVVNAADFTVLHQPANDVAAAPKDFDDL